MANVKRPQRASVNGVRNRLNVRGKEPGYQYRIISDTEDRLLNLEARGYEFVEQKSDVKVGDNRVATPTSIGSRVTINLGGGRTGYLMRIKDEYFEEDQAAKKAEVDRLENALKHPELDGQYGKIEIG